MAIAGRATITQHSVQIAYEGREPLINALRKAAKAKGMRVVSGSMGNQVTPVGTVKLSMMTIVHRGRVDEIQGEIDACDRADVFAGMRR